MIYQLKYPTKEVSIQDLIAKGVYTEEMQFGNNVQAVVEIGLIVDTYIDEVAVYFDGYHYDVMADNIYDFGINLVEPKDPKHAFAGHAVTEEMATQIAELANDANSIKSQNFVL